jgi:hypothetical protein
MRSFLTDVSYRSFCCDNPLKYTVNAVFVAFEVLTAASMKTPVFWFVASLIR